MKKIFYSILILVFSINASYAVVDSQYLASPQALRNSGYSSEISRLVKATTKDLYTVEEPKSSNVQKTAKDVIINIFRYIDPAIGSDDFANKDIKFYNVYKDTL